MIHPLLDELVKLLPTKRGDLNEDMQVCEHCDDPMFARSYVYNKLSQKEPIHSCSNHNH